MNKIIALYPGKFKPVTGGHLNNIITYLSNEKIGKVIVVISRKPKEGFIAKTSKEFLERLFAYNIGKGSLEVIISEDIASPIGFCYNYVDTKSEESDNIQTYCMISSNKEARKSTDKVRIEEFTKAYGYSGDKQKENVIIRRPKISLEPVYYEDETYKDRLNEPISSTFARDDVKSDNINKFYSNYPNYIIEKVYDVANVDYNTFNEYLNDYYTKLRNDLKENGETLNEGGLGGHISHVIDFNDFTIKDYKNIIEGVLDGSIELVEKVDGQNCFISYRNDGFVFARNKKQIDSPSLMLEDLMTVFSSEEIGNMYYVACKEFSSKLDSILSENEKRVIFEDGGKWINFEIIDKKHSNIIKYNSSYIVLHNVQEYDCVTKDLSIDDEEYTDVLFDHIVESIEDFQNVHNVTSYFKVIKPNKIEIDTDVTEQYKSELFDELDNLSERLKIDDNTTLAEVVYKRLNHYLINDIEFIPFRKLINNSDYENLMERWVYNDKSVKLNSIINKIDKEKQVNLQENIDFVKTFDKNVGSFVMVVKQPFHEIITKLGDYVINCSTNILNTDIETKECNSRSMEERLNKVEDLYNYKDKINQYNPSEGVVFVYKGHLMKLTGSFYYVNKIYHNVDGDPFDRRREDRKDNNEGSLD